MPSDLSLGAVDRLAKTGWHKMFSHRHACIKKLFWVVSED